MDDPLRTGAIFRLQNFRSPLPVGHNRRSLNLEKGAPFSEPILSGPSAQFQAVRESFDRIYRATPIPAIIHQISSTPAPLFNPSYKPTVDPGFGLMPSPAVLPAGDRFSMIKSVTPSMSPPGMYCYYTGIKSMS